MTISVPAVLHGLRLLIIFCLLAAPALAQQPAPPAVAPQTGMSAAELDGLASQLEDEAGRRRLIETLRALSAAQKAQPGQATPTDTKPTEAKPAPAPATA